MQGLRARVTAHPDTLIITSRLADGTVHGPLALPMAPAALLAAAREGGFFSYAAGVAYKLLVHHHVGGLVVDNFCSDLPAERGLSSSAAVCVLVARAFNRVYDLKLTVRGEMEFAYQGEILTPSQCGRMDQVWPYGGLGFVDQRIALVG